MTQPIWGPDTGLLAGAFQGQAPWIWIKLGWPGSLGAQGVQTEACVDVAAS